MRFLKLFIFCLFISMFSFFVSALEEGVTCVDTDAKIQVDGDWKENKNQEYTAERVTTTRASFGYPFGYEKDYWDECVEYAYANETYRSIDECSGTNCYVREWVCVDRTSVNYGDYSTANETYIPCHAGCKDDKCVIAEGAIEIPATEIAPKEKCVEGVYCCDPALKTVKVCQKGSNIIGDFNYYCKHVLAEYVQPTLEEVGYVPAAEEEVRYVPSVECDEGEFYCNVFRNEYFAGECIKGKWITGEYNNICKPCGDGQYQCWSHYAAYCYNGAWQSAEKATQKDLYEKYCSEAKKQFSWLTKILSWVGLR